jgi:nucleotide-binding universal stress UspA family protein
MYRHILIPTDGSELAEHAVTNGLSLAKSVGAKVTVIIVEEPFNWQSVSDAQAQRALDELFKHAEQIKKHAASVLNRAADAAKQAGEGRVSLSSHHCNGRGQVLRSHRHGIARAQRTIRNCARQCYKQGADAHENPGVGVSLNAPAARLAALSYRPCRHVSYFSPNRAHLGQKFCEGLQDFIKILRGWCACAWPTKFWPRPPTEHERTKGSAIVVVIG